MPTKAQRRAARQARRQDRRENRKEKIGGLLGNLPGGLGSNLPQGLQNMFGLNQQGGGAATAAGGGNPEAMMARMQARQQGGGGWPPGQGGIDPMADPLGGQQVPGGVQQNPAYGDPVFSQQTAQTFGAIADPNQVTPRLPLGTAGAAPGEEQIDEQIV